MKIRWPRTKLGWKNLFWISLHRCMRCHGPTFVDLFICGLDRSFAVCFRCNGVPMQPSGLIVALRLNYLAEENARRDDLEIEA